MNSRVRRGSSQERATNLTEREQRQMTERRFKIAESPRSLRPYHSSFRRLIERELLDFVGSCGEGGVGPFISPIQDLGSNRAILQEPILSSNSPRSPSLMSFVTRQAPSVVPIQICDFSLTLAFTHADTEFFQVRSPLERYILNSAVLSPVDFVQDLYLKELKVYKPPPDALRSSSSPVPSPQNSFVALSLSLGCQ